MKIVKYKEESSFAEIFQQNSIKFAYAKPNGRGKIEQLHGFVDCRDFLGDVLWSEEQNNKINIYCFKWDPAEQKIARDKTYLLVKFNKTNWAEQFKKNLHKLNNYEKTWHFTPTTIKETDQKNVYLITGSKMYLRKIWLISLYTFLIKCYSLSEDSFDTLTGKEKEYYQQVGEKKFWNLMNNLLKFMKIGKGVTHSSCEGVHTVHYQSGFVDLCTTVRYTDIHPKFQKMFE